MFCHADEPCEAPAIILYPLWGSTLHLNPGSISDMMDYWRSFLSTNEGKSQSRTTRTSCLVRDFDILSQDDNSLRSICHADSNPRLNPGSISFGIDYWRSFLSTNEGKSQSRTTRTSCLVRDFDILSQDDSFFLNANKSNSQPRTTRTSYLMRDFDIVSQDDSFFSKHI
jgi:hypothetical protein